MPSDALEQLTTAAVYQRQLDRSSNWEPEAQSAFKDFKEAKKLAIPAVLVEDAFHAGYRAALETVRSLGRRDRSTMPLNLKPKYLSKYSLGQE